MSPVTPLRTPARLTITGAAKLPRLLLLVLGCLYIFPGLFYRDPWKTDDAVGLASMLSALEQQTWWLPHIGDMVLVQAGPLTTWIGSLCIAWFAPVFALWNTPNDAAIIAARLPNVLWFGLAASAVWYGTYLLGRRAEAQPLSLPFGGEPSAQDYGRMLADAALLLFVASVGILWHMHETAFVPALLALHALAFYALARMLDRPISGAITLGLALGSLFLTRGTIAALPITLASLALCLPRAPLAKRGPWIVLALAMASALLFTWILLATRDQADAMQRWGMWQALAFDWPRIPILLRALRDLPWFLWPTWPYALLALWHWRRWLRAPHLAIAWNLLLLPLLGILFLHRISAADYSLLVIPSVVLAAFSLPTLRRDAVTALDWFSVMCFSLAIATIWFGWFAQQTGWPAQIARNIALQTSGFDAVIVWPAVLIALLGTLGWIALVHWRLHHKPLALWRGTVLCAGGVISTWLLLSTLWMPSLDYARSYRQVSEQLHAALQQHLTPSDCIRTQALGLGQRASFFVFNRITFADATHCVFVLQQTSPRAMRENDPHGTLIWEGKRAADRHEMFRLWRVQP